MLVTSTDLLKVVGAFAIFWIGLALGFAVFYMAMTIRNIWLISESAKRKVLAIEKVVTAFKGKVENTASYIPPLIDAVTKIIETRAAKRQASTDSGKKKKK